MNELDLFAAAIAVIDLGERARLLDRECAGRPDLRQRIDQLLDAHFRSHPFLDRPVPEVTGAYAPNEQPGVVIAGRYKLLEAIGEGGMGTVWVAEQTEPVKRKVALKLIKAGMDSRSVLARFEAERQALAVMDHPNIAKVLDGGLTETGRPFFVMEYVKGVPITEYCDTVKLSVPERLTLFTQVCSAVQHAHQKGIIHRDLKPSNILVAPYDDKPVPKVIDFGLAKAMHQSLTDKTLHTAHETVLGTPLYMSPEQAQLNNLDVDTRSDIYSLGVLLYELLTGTTPLEKQRFKQAAWDEVRRIIREEEPPRPSARLSSTNTLPSLALNRQTEPLKLTRQVRGELDWIVMRALEKDRTRRYETANGFAMDVQRYLAGETVVAAPASKAYRLRKFVRRNRPQVIAASLVILALLAGVIGTSIGLWRADAARREAEAAADRESEERKMAVEAKAVAQAKETEANAVVKFFEDKVFAAGRPKGQDGGLGSEVLLKDAVAASLPALGNGFTDQPLVEARLRMTLGETFWYLGQAEKSAEQLEQARTLFIRHRGTDHPETLASMLSLANSYFGMNRQTEACKLYEEVLAIRKRVLPPDHPCTLGCMHNLANSYDVLYRYAEALKLREEVLAIRKRVLPPDHPDTLASMHSLARSYAALNRKDEALKFYEETLAIQKRVLPPDHPATLGSMTNLALSYAALNRHAEAIKLNEETLAIQKRVLPPDHPDILMCMHGMANSYAALNRHAEAIKLNEEVLAVRKRVLPKDHPDTLANMSNLAHSYFALNRHAEALKLREETLAIEKRVLPKDHANTLASMSDLAISYAAMNRGSEAIKLNEELLEIQKRVLPKDHPDTLKSMHNLAISFFTMNRGVEAIKLNEEVLATRKRVLPKDHPDTLKSMNNLAFIYAALNRHAEAIKHLEELLAIQKRVLPPEHPDTLKSMSILVFCYATLNRHAEALKLSEEALAIRKRVLPPGHPDIAMSIYNIVCEHARMIPKADDKNMQADLAMDWLRQAVAAGFKDAAHMKKDTNLDPLRDREDFKKLLAELEAKVEKK